MKKNRKPKPPANFDDNPPLSAAQIRAMRPAREVLPDLVAAHEKNRGGRPKIERPKVPLSLRIDPEILDAFKATGDGWQSRMNDALAKAAKRLTPA